MIVVDTIYLLPLARIGIKTDLLRIIVENQKQFDIDFSDINVSLISLFELQIIAARLGIPAEHVARAADIIFRSFTIIPFYEYDIIDISYELNNILNNYIRSVIVATAAALETSNKILITEDSIIYKYKDKLEEKYNIGIYRYKDIIEHLSSAKTET